MILRKSCCLLLAFIVFCLLLAPGAIADPGNERKEKIFAPLIADPRWPHFSMAYQHYTHDGGFGNIFAASFGETLPLYEDDAPSGGRWAVAVQAAGYIIHDLDTNSWDLVNEDYRGGLAFFYRQADWSGLISVYHNSSHVGDEFLLHNDVSRVNFSYEAVQTKLSYDAADSLRLYGGLEYLFSPDPDDLKRWMTQLGVEFRGPRKYFNDLIRPVAGLDIKNWQENDWQAEVSLRMGGELESEKMLWSRLHLMFEYFNGPSPNGQFHEDNIEYLGLGTHFYF